MVQVGRIKIFGGTTTISRRKKKREQMAALNFIGAHSDPLHHFHNFFFRCELCIICKLCNKCHKYGPSKMIISVSAYDITARQGQENTGKKNKCGLSKRPPVPPPSPRPIHHLYIWQSVVGGEGEFFIGLGSLYPSFSYSGDKRNAAETQEAPK